MSNIEKTEILNVKEIKKEALNYISSCDKSHCYINEPIDSTLAHKTRGITTSIIVTE